MTTASAGLAGEGDAAGFAGHDFRAASGDPHGARLRELAGDGASEADDLGRFLR